MSSKALHKDAVLVDKRRVPDRRVNPDRRTGHSALTLIRRVFNTGEACRYLQISRPTFLKLITAGKIRAQKIGKGARGQWLIHMPSLLSYVGEMDDLGTKKHGPR